MLRTKSPIGAILLCGATLLLLMPVPGRSGQEPNANLPEEITWKLAELNKAPLRLVATQYDAKLRAVLWTLELTRDLDVVEDALYWAPAYRFEKRPLIRFEFQNAQGIILKTVDAKYFGEYVNKKGKRFGAFLAIPDEALPATKIVEAAIR
jgi:hypothetical protein